jgi:hypothetical protein
MQGISGLLIPTGRLVVFLRRCYGGQEGQEATNSEESRVRSNSPAAVLGAILAVARAGVAGEGLGGLPGGEAKLMRALAGSGVQQGGRSTVEQGVLRGGARRAEA